MGYLAVAPQAPSKQLQRTVRHKVPRHERQRAAAELRRQAEAVNRQRIVALVLAASAVYGMASAVLFALVFGPFAGRDHLAGAVECMFRGCPIRVHVSLVPSDHRSRVVACVRC